MPLFNKVSVQISIIMRASYSAFCYSVTTFRVYFFYKTYFLIFFSFLFFFFILFDIICIDHRTVLQGFATTSIISQRSWSATGMPSFVWFQFFPYIHAHRFIPRRNFFHSRPCSSEFPPCSNVRRALLSEPQGNGALCHRSSFVWWAQSNFRFMKTIDTIIY